MAQTEEEWRRHERAAWARWVASVATILIGTFITNNCAHKGAPLPPPPPQMR